VAGANPFDQFDAPAEANPFDQFDAPAAAPATPGGTSFSELAGAYGRLQGLGARATFAGGAKGLLSPGTLLTDAVTNVGYGAHKLAAKTGAVAEPNPETYYGKSDSYFPTTSGISDAVDQGLDKAAEYVPFMRKPETKGERMAYAPAEAVASAMGGVGLGRAIGGAAGDFLAARPGLQAASAAASGAAGQGVQEAGGGDKAAAVASILAGVATGAAGARVTRPGRAPVPTTEALRDARSAAYQAVDDSGITIAPRQTQRLAADLRQTLPDDGIFPHIDPRAGSALAGIERLGAPDAMGGRRPVTLAEFDKVRKNVGQLRASPDPEVRRTGSVITEEMDDFLGQVPQAGELFDTARTANRRYAKASALDIAMDKADIRAARTGTGSNRENVVRQNLSRFIEDPNKAAFRQFDAPERDAMRDIVVGDRTQNALRYVGRFAPTGVVSGMGAIGSAKAGFGAVPVAGLAARAIGDARFNRKLDRLDRLVKGGPAAVDRPSAGTRANAARGAAQGFLFSGGQDEKPGRGRYR
jgi:hypothetical protein